MESREADIGRIQKLLEQLEQNASAALAQSGR